MVPALQDCSGKIRPNLVEIVLTSFEVDTVTCQPYTAGITALHSTSSYVICNGVEQL